MTGPATAAKAELSRDTGLPDLVIRMADGDQEALASLYDQTSPLVNGLLLRMLRDREDAEEALVDTYMKAWKHSRNYAADRSSVMPWLMMMARGIAIDRIRRRRSQPQIYDCDADAACVDASPEQQTLDSEQRGDMQRILRTLSGDQRQVLLMAFFSGYTHSELSARLGQPLGTVKTRVRSALLKLRQLMETKS